MRMQASVTGALDQEGQAARSPIFPTSTRPGANAMRNNRLMLLIAVVSGILATVLAFSYISAAKSELETKDVEPTVSVLFLLNDMVANQSIRAEDLREEQVGVVTSPGLATGAVKTSEKEAVLGMRVSAPMSAGVPLLYSNLTPIKDVELKPGYRAIAIDVDAASTMGGILVPDDHVDIVVSYVRPAEPDGTSGFDPADPGAIGALMGQVLGQVGGSSVPSDWQAEIVLEDVRVIAVGQLLTASRQAQMFGMAGVGGGGDTVTLELLPEDALKLIRARAGGSNSLTLLLRPEATAVETSEWKRE